ncbi:helix-turn-helix domain-containing protein [Pseudoalteromonas piscicida]|uniref:helix-turn-helix domain-containing protein n=1 Tax=Pseudoalteromonas piscicida TaxID=43662 RepID=UPI001C98488D|nr:helix-turn-helix transcriptional regulator [Pseudoalteromonas piscicida]QZO12221.1 helix-turn-helix domain-containing protein [Pseudoalteromonas piscicida]
MQTPEEYEVTLRIRELLKELKKRKGYTKKTISQKLGIGLTTLDDYLNGTSSFRLGTLIKLSEICRIQLSDILEGAGHIAKTYQNEVSNTEQKKEQDQTETER